MTDAPARPTPAAAVPDAPLVPDSIELDVPVGGRVLVCSDLHLAREASTASTAASTELAQTVESLRRCLLLSETVSA